MSGLFGGGKAPATQAPAVMPDSQSPAVIEAGRQQRLQALQRAGKQSTILQDYANTSLGGGP